MINKNQIAEIARKILSHSEGLHNHKIMHPERDWFIGLGLGIMLLTLGACGGIYFYWKNSNLNTSLEVTSTEEIAVYRESVVKEALSRFEKRNKEREALVAEFSKETPAPVAIPEVVPSAAEEQGSTTVSIDSSEEVRTSGL